MGVSQSGDLGIVSASSALSVLSVWFQCGPPTGDVPHVQSWVSATERRVRQSSKALWNGMERKKEGGRLQRHLSGAHLVALSNGHEFTDILAHEVALADALAGEHTELWAGLRHLLETPAADGRVIGDEHPHLRATQATKQRGHEKKRNRVS